MFKSLTIDQMMTVMSGLFSVFLLFVAVAVAQSGGDFDFNVIFGNIGKVVLGQSIGGVTLSFDVLLKCLVIPIAGHYFIKIVRRWLTKRLFPTTALDKGGQTSIDQRAVKGLWGSSREAHAFAHWKPPCSRPP